jgi:hypothetical protein
LIGQEHAHAQSLIGEDFINENNARVIDWFQQHYQELHGEVSSERRQWAE